MSANALAKALGQNDMTTRLYLGDMEKGTIEIVIDGKTQTVKVKKHRINKRMVLYKLPRASPKKPVQTK